MFWDLIEYLVSTGLLEEGVDYKIEEKSGWKNVSYDKPKYILYLSFAKAFPLYREYHKRQLGKDGLTKSSLSHYLKTHPGFIDYLKSTRMGRKNTSAFVFDYDGLGINIKEEPKVSYDYTAENEIWEEMEEHRQEQLKKQMEAQKK